MLLIYHKTASIQMANSQFKISTNKNSLGANYVYGVKYPVYIYMKSSDAKASKCHLKFSSLMMIFLSNLYI